MSRVYCDPTAPNQLIRKWSGRCETVWRSSDISYAIIIPPISWWFPGQHCPLPAPDLDEVTTSVFLMQQCIITLRHDVCLHLTFKCHCGTVVLRRRTYFDDHSAVIQPSLVILPKSDPNRQFFRPCDLEIWWMTLKNIRELLPYP